MTILQAGDGARLKGFIAGPFDVKAGGPVRGTPEGFYAAGKGFPADHRAKLDLDAGTLCFWGGGATWMIRFPGRLK